MSDINQDIRRIDFLLATEDASVQDRVIWDRIKTAARLGVAVEAMPYESFLMAPGTAEFNWTFKDKWGRNFRGDSPLGALTNPEAT